MKVVCDRQVGRRMLLMAWLAPLAASTSLSPALTALQTLACLDRMGGRTYKQTHGRTDVCSSETAELREPPSIAG
jgi:hypothetical protein